MKKKNSQLEFLYHIHKDVNEYIKFCDEKAGIILASSGVLLPLLLKWATDANFQFGGIQFYLFFCGLAFLSISLTASFYSVYPRTDSPKLEGLFFWENILLKKPEDYIKAISTLDEDEILSEIALNVHNVSAVAHRKYNIVKFSMIILGIAFIFLVSLWLSTVEFSV